MNKEQLIESADKLVQPSLAAALDYETNCYKMVEEMNRIMVSRADLTNLIGINNISMMEDNHQNHARFMLSVFLGYYPQILVETVIWVFKAYRAHGFTLAYWPAQLNLWIPILESHLKKESFDEIYPFYNWMIINQPAFANQSERLLIQPPTT